MSLVLLVILTAKEESGLSSFDTFFFFFRLHRETSIKELT